ncbi:porin [Rhodoferax sp. U11-2br]|nr:porin [Rhodoferax sp. U11-2br]
MKKSLIALAVLAASGAAMAQSSVTIYGIADVWFGTVKTNNGTSSLTQTKLDSGGVNGSRWGLKGSEDLGGGLKANFQLEQGFDMDSGKGGTTSIAGVDTAAAFSRQSWVGLSGDFGAVKLGRTPTPFDDINGASNAVFDSALSATKDVFLSTGYTVRPNNTLFYQAPTFGGFSGAISYSLGEDKTASTSATSTTSMNLTYAAGPLAVQFGYQVQDIVNATATSADLKYTRLGASYNFGVATLKASYGAVDNVGNVNGADTSEYQIGVDFPVSSALTLSGSIAKSDDNAKAGDAERTGYALGAKYDLSKRTFVYGGYRHAKTDNVTAADTKTDVFAVGVQHRF